MIMDGRAAWKKFHSITGLLEGDPVFHLEPQGAGAKLNIVSEMNGWSGFQTNRSLLGDSIGNDLPVDC